MGIFLIARTNPSLRTVIEGLTLPVPGETRRKQDGLSNWAAKEWDSGQ